MWQGVLLVERLTPISAALDDGPSSSLCHVTEHCHLGGASHWLDHVHSTLLGPVVVDVGTVWTGRPSMVNILASGQDKKSKYA